MTGRSLLVVRFALLLTGILLAGVSRAQLVDDIEVRSDQGVAEIRLRFAVPVRYIKHFPTDNGQIIKLFLQVLSLDGIEEIEPREYKHIRVTAPVPAFSVTYSTVRTCHSVRDPLCLDIQFNKAVRFDVRPGEDGRSIVLHVLPELNTTPSKRTKH